MARVNVRDTACHDARLKVAGKVMGLHYERLGWRLIPVWSRVTEMNSPIVSLTLLSADLGKPADVVAAGLIAGELAESSDKDHLDLSQMMGALFDDYQWLARKRKDGSDDGPSGPTPTGSDSLRDRAIACLASGPLRANEVRKALGIRRAVAQATVRDLLADGVAVKDKDGLIALADTVSGTAGTDNPVPGTQNAVPGTQVPVPGTQVPVPGTDAVPANGYPVPVPVAPLAPAPAPAPARASSAHTRTREDALAGPPPTSEPLEQDTVVPQAERRAVARRLWQYQNQCRAQLDPLAPNPPLNDIPGGSLDAVILALARYSPGQCRHALDMFAAEGAQLARAGDDALKFLNGRTNWKPEQLDRAIATTAEAIEKRARAAARASSNPGEERRRIQRLA